MRKFGQIIMFTSIMVFSVCITAGATTGLREKMYEFFDTSVVWKPLLTHVICDNCPAHRRPPVALSSSISHKLKDVKIPAKPCALTKAPVALEIPGRVITVHFDFDSSFLTNSAMSKIKVFAEELKKSSIAPPLLKITGYTDGVGSKEYNDKLAFNRAVSVYKTFESLGLSLGGMRLYGIGKCCYVEKDNPTNEKNRRVKVIEIMKTFVSGKRLGCVVSQATRD